MKNLLNKQAHIEGYVIELQSLKLSFVSEDVNQTISEL